MHELPAGTSTALRRGRAWAFWLAALPVLSAAAPACKLNQQGVPPPLDRISFPASALVDPDGRWLYVANSNSDLRYNSGTLVAVDLDRAVKDRFGTPGTPAQPAPTWGICAGADRVRLDTDPAPCCWDYLDHQILNCDERLYVPPDSTAEIGSFSAGMVFQSFTDPACVPGGPAATGRHACSVVCSSEAQGRLFIGVRGNSSLTYAETTRLPYHDQETRPAFSCPDEATRHGDVCQIMTTMPGASAAAGDLAAQPVIVPDEPYALALEATQDLLYVGNLRNDTTHPQNQTGGISLFDVARSAAHTPPTFIRPTAGFFNPDANGNVGITSLTPHAGQIYATSRYGTSAVNVVPAPLDGKGLSCDTDPATISLAAGSDVFTAPLAGAEIRGIQFLPDAPRAYMLQRVPPALISFDISTDPTAFGNFPSEVLETCAGPTFLQSYDAGEGTRLYVTCFDAGQIYVFDPYVPRLVSVINAGRGPAGIAFPQTPRTDRPERLAYVVGFSANDIPVLDLTPGSATQYHVVQRIGFPSAVPR